MKNKFKLALVLIFMLSALCLFAACAGQTDPDAIAMDEQTAQTETADSETETAAEAAAEEAAADADAASDTEEAVDEESGSSGGLFGGGAASAYSGPRTKVGKMFAGWFASLFEWIYLLTYKIGMPSWILTVFLFTLIVRGAMQPLMGKQMRSSRKMQLLKPEMEEIKKRYASNPQKMNEATQALYKEHDCSPTAGCLPLLIQMPILIWLFGAIRTYNPLNSSYEAIVNSNFSFLWLKDLAEPDPTGWALPLLVAAATFAQTWLTTADRTDRTQRMMMFMMPLMFFFFSRSFPALMCFYWFFYSLLSAAIMWPFMKKGKRKTRPASPKSAGPRRKRRNAAVRRRPPPGKPISRRRPPRPRSPSTPWRRAIWSRKPRSRSGTRTRNSPTIPIWSWRRISSATWPAAISRSKKRR
ncbi:MAG: membrane protein insertase YidC [Firmicutes bacterium]|nr:membrane protein insertase YidC [Bacillota bacterium]